MDRKRIQIGLAAVLMLLMALYASSALAADRTVSEKPTLLGTAVTRNLSETDLGQSGWVWLDGETYYGDENGTAVSGLRRINGKYYFFDEEGRLQTGWVLIREKMWKYAGEDGAILTTFSGLSEIRIPAEVDYLTAASFTGIGRTFMIRCDAGSYAESFALAHGLQYSTGSRTVRGCDITSVREKVDWIVANYITSGMSDREKARVLHDWLIYNAHYYYTYTSFSADGVLLRGSGVCDSYAKAYCLLLNRVGIENCRITGNASGEGHAWNLVRVGGQWYHVDCTWDDPNDSGSAVVSGYENADYFLKGDAFMKESRTFDEDLSADSNYAGWVNWGDRIRYYGRDGQMATGFQAFSSTVELWSYATGWTTQEVVRTYYFDAQGCLYIGWLKLEGNTYYFLEDGQMAIGIETIGGERYYFDENGVLRENRWVQQAGGRWFCMDPDGNWLTGWVQDSGKWYYVDPYTGMRIGWNQVGNTWYYMDESGVMQTGWMELGGVRFLLDDGGAMQTGWVYVQNGWYYFDRSGAMRTGWVEVDGGWYYLGNDGKMRTGWQQISGKWYLLDGSGVMQTGWIQRGGVWYDFDENGAMRTGWYEETKNGRSRWYWFDENGAMATGWAEIHGTWEFFDGSGVWQYTWDGN